MLGMTYFTNKPQSYKVFESGNIHRQSQIYRSSEGERLWYSSSLVSLNPRSLQIPSK